MRNEYYDDDFQSLTKKDRILKLRKDGKTSLREISKIADTTVSYAANVLRDAGYLKGYNDLYTSTSEPTNIYSDLFRGKLGYKNVDFAKQSVKLLNAAYWKFKRMQDRTGQHYVLSTALTLLDRARWCGKNKEAAEFRSWLVDRLND